MFQGMDVYHMQNGNKLSSLEKKCERAMTVILLTACRACSPLCVADIFSYADILFS